MRRVVPVFERLRPKSAGPKIVAVSNDGQLVKTVSGLRDVGIGFREVDWLIRVKRRSPK